MAIQLKMKTVGAELVRKGLEDLTRAVPHIGRERIYQKARAVLKIMKVPGRKPSYPINWDSERQRRFVLAMLREKDNLPYQRTGALPAGWTIERAGENGYRLQNTADAAVYVYGNYEGARQSKIHKSRHPVFQEVMENAINELPPDIEKHISYYGRQKGF